MDFKDLAARYFLMIALGLFIGIFYIVFLPLTLYPLYFLLKIFFTASLSANIITANGISIEIIDACVAGSAYFLLLILNFSTPKIKFRKRMMLLAIDFSAFLLFNIIRIFILSVLLVNGSIFFDLIHLIFFYAVSVLLVVLIWIITAKIFEIKKIPFVSDITLLYRKARK